MNCEQVQEEIIEQLDEAHSLRLRKEAIEHLAHCDKCRRVFDEVETIRNELELDRVSTPSTPEWSGFSDKVWAVVSNANGRKCETKSRNWGWPNYPKSKFIPASLVMAVLLLVISTNYLSFRYGAISGGGGHNESYVAQLARNGYTENRTEQTVRTNSYSQLPLEAITGEHHDGSLELMATIENRQKVYEFDRSRILSNLKQALQVPNGENKIEMLIHDLNDNNLRYLNEQISLQHDFIAEHGVRQLANCLLDDASPLTTGYVGGCKGVNKR